MDTLLQIIKDCKAQMRLDKKAEKICKSHPAKSEQLRAKYYGERIDKLKFTIQLIEKYL